MKKKWTICNEIISITKCCKGWLKADLSASYFVSSCAISSYREPHSLFLE